MRKIKMNATANLGKAPVRTLVLQLAIPSMTAQFVNVLYSIIDRMYIGHISENGALALAGAGICGPIVTLLTSFGTLVGIGGSITMGIRMGEKNHKKAEQVLANSFLMLSIFSVLLTVSFLLLKDKLLMLFGASGATFPFANTYLTIYTTGTFFALMATGLNYFINCQGFPLVGMFTVLIGAGCNILSDPIFIFGFHMGISGAAIATVISQILSCIFAMTFLLGKKVPVKITFGQYNLKVIRKILSLGFSPFLILATDSLILIFMNTVLQEIWWCFPGRYANHLCHHCSKLSASDHLTYDRDQRRYTGNPELQLRCQMRKQGQGRRKEHSGSNAYLYHHHVPSLPVYSPVLCSSVYH